MNTIIENTIKIPNIVYSVVKPFYNGVMNVFQSKETIDNKYNERSGLLSIPTTRKQLKATAKRSIQRKMGLRGGGGGGGGGVGGVNRRTRQRRRRRRRYTYQKH